MRAVLVLSLPVICAAVTAPLAEGRAGQAPVLGPASSPHAFRDDLKARLVSADHLWMFVTGKVDGPQTNELRAFKRNGRKWSRDQRLTATVDPDQNIAGGTIETKRASRQHPCVGFTASSHEPVLSCRINGGWRELVDSDRLGKLGTLSDMRAADRGLLALFSTVSGSHQVLRVIRVSPSGRISRAGNPIRTKRAIAFLGLAGSPSIHIQEQSSADRYVLGLRDDNWRRITDKLHGDDGPLVSGGASVNGREVIPVSNAAHSPWTFSTFTFGPNGWRGTKLSAGPGDAQGNLSQTGTKVIWAIWQESDYHRGSFDTRIRISRYIDRHRGFSPAASVFRGLSPGPGDLQVVRWHGRSFVLYLAPRVEGGRTLRAFVRPVR